MVRLVNTSINSTSTDVCNDARVESGVLLMVELENCKYGINEKNDVLTSSMQQESLQADI